MRIFKNLVAILSTTIISADGVYKIETLSDEEKHHLLHGVGGEISGIDHYIGHPATKGMVESSGALKAQSNLFPGLKPGESALCFPIKQGRSTRVTQGSTSPDQSVSADDLDCKIITRIS